MTAPAAAAVCWLRTVAVGAILGVIYGFLRPLRPRLTTLADSIFAVAAIWGWVYMVFKICGGDSRLSCTMALFLGAWVWDVTLGRLFRPLFTRFWQGMGHIFWLIVWPLKKITHCFLKIYNFLLAILKKWVTIGETITKAGGCDHDKSKTLRQAGDAQDKPRHKSRHSGRRHSGRGGSGRPVQLH